MDEKRKTMPAQSQEVQPAKEREMNPSPVFDDPSYLGSGKLHQKIAIITGADSGIGRAVAVAFAKEGAHITACYHSNDQDAEDTRKAVEKYDRECFLIKGDAGDEGHCREIVSKTLQHFKKIDILVNNAAEQHVQTSIEDISAEQLLQVFKTNIFSYFYLSKAVLPHLKPGSAIVNTTSVTAYRGSPHLIDYSSTKGAIVTFTRSLSKSLVEKGIRVNAVAPGPIWTPLIVGSFTPEKVEQFGADTAMKRPGQPSEVAPCFVFLASRDSSYISGQVLHPNGGDIING